VIAETYQNRLRALVATPRRRTAMRYCLLSLVNVAVGQILLAILFGVLGWTAVRSNVTATAIALAPAFWASKRFVWQEVGRSHVVREIVPFCSLAFLGLVLSTWFAALAQTAATELASSRSVQTLIVMGGVGLGFGIVWVLRFLVLDRLVFASAAS
jgi:putative flippase GtrA